VARAGTTIILITHHIEEIVPEIQRIVLVNHGRIAASGPKREILTSARISDLFDAPIVLEEDDGYFYARPTLAAKK
jgi:iron complex transport system ATP-binding protein